MADEDPKRTLSCPAPLAPQCVELAHGAGGRRSRQLLDSVFGPLRGDGVLERSTLVDGTRHDSAVLALGAGSLAFTTDAYVISPLVFPGGDIGKLAACGTLNDLAVVGARPIALCASFILEEGLSFDTLRLVVDSMSRTVREQGVRVAAGDTKVVERGRCDGIYITTSGIGQCVLETPWSPNEIAPGDVIVVSGDLGRHGIAVMAEREGLGFDGALPSDCAVLWPLVESLLSFGAEVHCLRDLTRGGLASALLELCSQADVSSEIRETQIPVAPSVAGACELLGLDPLYVANEGRFVAFVEPTIASLVVRALRGAGADAAAIIGEVTHAGGREVVLRSAYGNARVLDGWGAEQLPRIC